MQSFSFSGRVSRLGYWRRSLLVSALMALVWAIGNFAIIGLGRIGAVVFIGFLPLVVWWTATVIRRLHDRDRGGVWFVVFVLGPWVMLAIAQQFGRTSDVAGAWIAIVASLASLGLSVWGLVEMGFRRGSEATHRFGAPPAYGR